MGRVQLLFFSCLFISSLCFVGGVLGFMMLAFDGALGYVLDLIGLGSESGEV